VVRQLGNIYRCWRAKNGARCYDGGHLGKDLSAQDSAFNCKSPALVICQPELLVTQLLPEDPVFLVEVINDQSMPPVDPGCEGQQEEL